MIDSSWVKRVNRTARGTGDAKMRAGERLLIASIIACAISDVAAGGDHAVDAARYLLGPVYQHHASILGRDELPAGLSPAMLQQLISSAEAEANEQNDTAPRPSRKRQDALGRVFLR